MSDATADVAPHLPQNRLTTLLFPSTAPALLLRPSSAATVVAGYSAVRILLPLKPLPWDAFSFSTTSLSKLTSPLLPKRYQGGGRGLPPEEQKIKTWVRLEAKQAGSTDLLILLSQDWRDQQTKAIAGLVSNIEQRCFITAQWQLGHILEAQPMG